LLPGAAKERAPKPHITMPLGANPPTLLEAQDIINTVDFRAALRRENPARPPRSAHDFLVLNPRPDLTPELLADAACASIAHS
jgi:hypothetical protein